MDNNRRILKLLVNTFYDFQLQYNRINNKLKLKKNGEQQKIIEEYSLNAEDVDFMIDLRDTLATKIKEIQKKIESVLERFPIYTQWLKGVKGINFTMGAVIISEYDIHIAENVSKMWAYTGLNPGMVKGYKWNEKKKCRELTEDLVKGDKLTKGYCSPFNKWLKSKMIGVLADSFIKQRTMPYRKIYDDTKHRLESKDYGANKMQRHLYSCRKMLQYFLIDLYKAWRELEGLTVREPYKDEYLKKHND